MFVKISVCLLCSFMTHHPVTKLGMALSGKGAQQAEYKLLGQQVGQKCLASLLGVGHARIDKVASGAPDLRYGAREYESRAATFTVDSFLQVAYDAIGETLPDRPVP